MTLRVPAGTQLYSEDGELIADLAGGDSRVIAARGGAGGRGNRKFATPTRRTPRFAEVGLPGEELELDLRLKLMADAALVGLRTRESRRCSAGSRTPNRRSPITPSTTLAPVLRHGRLAKRTPAHRRRRPRLIEVLARESGLGHEFLAHLERARLLVP